MSQSSGAEHLEPLSTDTNYRITAGNIGSMDPFADDAVRGGSGSSVLRRSSSPNSEASPRWLDQERSISPDDIHRGRNHSQGAGPSYAARHDERQTLSSGSVQSRYRVLNQDVDGPTEEHAITIEPITSRGPDEQVLPAPLSEKTAVEGAASTDPALVRRGQHRVMWEKRAMTAFLISAK